MLLLGTGPRRCRLCQMGHATMLLRNEANWECQPDLASLTHSNGADQPHHVPALLGTACNRQDAIEEWGVWRHLYRGTP